MKNISENNSSINPKSSEKKLSKSQRALVRNKVLEAYSSESEETINMAMNIFEMFLTISPEDFDTINSILDGIIFGNSFPIPSSKSPERKMLYMGPFSLC